MLLQLLQYYSAEREHVLKNKNRYLNYAGALARAGNKAISCLALVLVLALVIYGSYSIYNIWQIYHGAYLDDDIAELKPTEQNHLSLEELRKINEDVVGWITIDGTKIDYPFVQGKDNMEYINQDLYRSFSFSGTIFMDYRNSKDFSDHYNLLYGHHMRYGAMFGDIEKYRGQDFLDKNHTGTLIVDRGEYQIDLYAFIICAASDIRFFDAGPMSAEEFGKKLEYIKNGAAIYRDVDVAENDQIIVLSTCSESNSNDRMMLAGKLIKKHD